MPVQLMTIMSGVKRMETTGERMEIYKTSTNPPRESPHLHPHQQSNKHSSQSTNTHYHSSIPIQSTQPPICNSPTSSPSPAFSSALLLSQPTLLSVKLSLSAHPEQLNAALSTSSVLRTLIARTHPKFQAISPSSTTSALLSDNKMHAASSPSWDKVSFARPQPQIRGLA